MGLGLFKHPQKPLVSIRGADPDSTQAVDSVSLRQHASALPAPKDFPSSISEMLRELGTALSPYRSKTYSTASLELALQRANHDLYQYLLGRNKELDPARHPYVMTQFDETRFFRLGEDGTKVGYGVSGRQLLHLRTELTKLGYPEIVPDELQLVLNTRFRSLRASLPNARLVAQHYPCEATGSSTLEATETQAVHIPRVAHASFRRLQAQGLVDAVMLGHASFPYDETNFPGISAIRRHTPLHPALRGVDPNSIPASLNPWVVKYLRQVEGFKGVIIPDWYDMEAINRFVDSIPASNFGLPAHVMDFMPNERREQERAAKIAILASHAGVSFYAGIPHHHFPMRADRSGYWEAFRRNSPLEYGRFAASVDKQLYQTINSVAPDCSLTLQQLEKVPLWQKTLFLSAYRKAQNFNFLTDVLERSAQAPELGEILRTNGIADYDVWNRSGVMTLIQRQRMLEHLTGERFANPPTTVGGEDAWFKSLMGNPNFVAAYRSIDWSSEEMAQVYRQALPGLARPQTRHRQGN